MQSATTSFAKLEAKLVASERHSRSFNVRLLGVPETGGANYVATVVDLLDRKFQLSGSAPVIENAYLIGKAQQDKPRHIIARFYSCVTRSTVMRTTRTNLRDSPLRFVDVLTKEDLLERNSEYALSWMNCSRQTGVRLSETGNYMPKADRYLRAK